MVGLTINPKWLKVQFVIIFIGVNMTFFPDTLLRAGRHAAAVRRLSRLFYFLERFRQIGVYCVRCVRCVFFVYYLRSYG